MTDQQPDDQISQDISAPMCPFCHVEGQAETLGTNLAVARAPHMRRSRYLCHNCDAIYQATSAPGYSDIVSIVRPGHIR